MGVLSVCGDRVLLHTMMLTLLAGLAATVLMNTQPAETTGVQPAQPAQEAAKAEPTFKVLVFSKTAGFRHDSIPEGIAAIRGLGEKHGFSVEATEDSAYFTAETLEPFSVVIFLSTTGDVLDKEQEGAFEAFIAKGRGYVGIHAASDTEYEWPWYGTLVGAYFKSHPQIQEAVINVEDRSHPSTHHLTEKWKRRDEWYNFHQSPRPRVQVLASLDETSYKGGENGDDHPIAWCHEVGGGRSWYTGGGHTKESFQEAEFLEHMAGGILWAAGKAEKTEVKKDAAGAEHPTAVQ